jgi:hypothetical protein
MQIKAIFRFSLTLVRMAIIKKTKTNAGENVGGGVGTGKEATYSLLVKK